MDITQVREHLKKNLAYVDRYRNFKKFWNEDVQIVAQHTIGTDADIFFEILNDNNILETGNLFGKLKVKIKRLLKKIFFKKYRTNRLDWFAVYFIVDLLAKVQEDLSKGYNPALKISAILQRLGNKEYYNMFPNQNCNEVKMYKLLAIKLAQSLQILNFIEKE